MTDLDLLFDNQIESITVDKLLSSDQVSIFLNTLYQQPEWKTADIAAVHEHLFTEKPKPKHLFLSQYMVRAFNTTEDEYLVLSKNYLTIWKKWRKHRFIC